MEKQPKKRKTLTMTYELFEAVSKVKSPEERLQIYEIMFNHFFKNKPIDHSKIESETVSSILAFMMPDIRKIQSKYDNRIGKKSTKNNASLFLCNQKVIEQQQPTTAFSTSDYYNIYNIINNIYLIINQSVSNSKNNNSYINITNKDIMTKSLQEISQENATHYEALVNVINEVASKEKIKINGVWVERATALDTIAGLLVSQEGVQQLSLKIDEVAQTQGLKNKLGYLTSALYNLSKDLAKNLKSNISYKSYNQSKSNSGMLTHNYTAEQLNSVYDDLDTVEI